ncbi:MAG: lysophospholipid acyltransferase family protein [Candidatus Muiribacteriota bacterium]
MDLKRTVGLYIFKIVNFLLFHTLRIKTYGEENLKKFKSENKGFIVTFWHGEQYILTQYLRGYGLNLITSLSADGELQTRYLTGLGYKCIRGSSSKGGTKALRDMLKVAGSGNYEPFAIAVDGPRGPMMVPKEGAFFLSFKSKMPVIPTRIKYSKAYVFNKAWDKYHLPYPFSKVEIFFGDPLTFDNNFDFDKIKPDFIKVMDEIGDKRG